MELTLDEALQKAVEAHKAGQIQEADRLYTAILNAQPKHPDANHNMGVLAVSVGKVRKSLPFFKTALGANPKIEQFWLSYIDALIKEKQFDNAKQVLEKAKKQGLAGEKLNTIEVQLFSETQIQNVNSANPPQEQLSSLLEYYQTGRYGDAEKLVKAITQEFPKHQFAWKVLGAVLKQTGRISESFASFQKSVQLAPQDAEAHNNLGVTLQKLGRLDQSEASYKQAIALKPDYAEAHCNLGTTLHELGRLDEAEAIYTQAKVLKPDYARAHNNLGNTLKKLGRFDEAEASYSQAITLKPDLIDAHYNLGITLQELGRLDEAESSYLQAITLKPGYAEAQNNLGITLKQLGRLDEAEASYTQAIELKPDLVDAHYNLGITLQELGRFHEAEASYSQAITLMPDLVDAHYNLGIILQELGRFDEAEASYSQAITLKPDLVDAHYNLGITLQELGKWHEAEASYAQTIALKPEYVEAYLNLCEVLEKTNKVDAALSVIKNTNIKIFEKEANFLFLKALIYFRQENYEIAERLIIKIKKDELSVKRKAPFLKLKAELYHYKTNYSAAFKVFKEINEIVKDSPEYKKQESEKFFSQQREKVFQIEQLQEKFSYKTVIQATWLQPTFLIGFPRSGTTLLDTILRTHSNIDVLEELPMLKKMTNSLGNLPNISMTEQIGQRAAEIASGVYLEELKKHIEVGKKQIVIDKLPLNILQLPLINQIFPNAKFVMALRHPLDCVLSCWMQNFKLNPAMANMVDLERIADFFCTAMQILKYSQKRYSLDIHRIRYEDLVFDFEENVSNLLTFLNLKWEKELINYQKTALSRGRIITPSYSQVVKPIYTTASYRWKYYEEYLEPYKLRLAPWIQEYGYSS